MHRPTEFLKFPLVYSSFSACSSRFDAISNSKFIQGQKISHTSALLSRRTCSNGFISSELQTECWFTKNTNTTSLLPFVTKNNCHIFKSYSFTGLDRPLLFQEGGKVVIPTHRPPLLPTSYPWYSFLTEEDATTGP